MTPPNPDALPSGFEIAGFKIERVLGRGAFGTVYGGVRLSDGTRAAVKIMTGKVLELTGGDERFRREAELSRRLSHPNIVRVLDAGVDRGLLFTAFELLEGHSLQDEMARAGPMPVRRAADIVTEVLSGLEEAHRVGIIHRDLKPANLFLALGPRGQLVKILDFGVAKSMNPNTVAGLTREGIALGTPAYMAPEQLAGHPATPASDIFALGLVAAELLMGRFVYGSDVSAIQILNERIGGGRAPLPQAVVGSALGPIILRATAPQAAQRFQSAGEMRAMLLSQLASLPAESLRAAPASLGSTFPLAPELAPTAVAQVPSKKPALAATVNDDGARSSPPQKRVAALAATVTDDGLAARPRPTSVRPTPRGPAASRRVWPFMLVFVLAILLGVGGLAAWRWYVARQAVGGATPRPAALLLA